MVQGLRPLPVDCADEKADDERNQCRGKGQYRDIAQPRSAQEEQCQERSVIKGAGDIGACIPLVAVLAFVAGSAYAITVVSAQTALFENMPAGVRGRVFGVLASIIGAASLVPILIAGPLADATSAPTVIAIAATGVLIVAGWSATLFGPRGSAG